VKKDLRKIVETCFIYVRMVRVGRIMLLGWFGIGWCQHREEGTAKDACLF
jgi:hypothetical protein